MAENEVLLIGSDGKKVGFMSFLDASKKASDEGLGLLAVNKDKNIYKIADVGKIKYEQKQKQKKQSAVKRAQKIKEIQVGLTIDAHDLNIKINHVRQFIKSGLKTKIVMRLKRSQTPYGNMAVQKMIDVANILNKDDNIVIENEPKLDGNNIILFVSPTKTK